MPCLCSKKQPCPIHKDKPLRYSEEINTQTIVIKVYQRWSNDMWFCTITKDAIRVFETGDCKTKRDAIDMAIGEVNEGPNPVGKYAVNPYGIQTPTSIHQDQQLQSERERFNKWVTEYPIDQWLMESKVSLARQAWLAAKGKKE